jgi:anaerobic magnesium-protoporphyrin IX monomethyl ester cyclase
MKILLIRPQIISHRIASDYEGRFVPVGLLLIAAVLERAGHRVRVIDQSVDAGADILKKELISFGPQLVGIGAMSVEYKKVLHIAALCRQVKPDCKIVIGGPIASASPHNLLGDTAIDYAVLGEGEESILELVNCFEQNQDVSGVLGIAYRKDGQVIINKRRASVDLTQNPHPARHLIDMQKYISSYPERFQDQRVNNRPIRGTNLTISRGCPYSCIYCDKNVFGKKWRVREVDDVLDEIEHLKNRYGINALMFDDDIFDLNKNWVRCFCEGIKKRGLKLIWHCNSRSNHSDTGLFKLMYEAGCRSLAFGIEYGNQAVLDRVKKKLTLKEIEQSVQMAKDAGFYTTGYFMIGMLDETRNSIIDTINFAVHLPLDAGGFGITVPMSGTELYRLSAARGLIAEDEWGQWDRTRYRSNLTRDLSYEELNKLLRLAGWKFFWTRPSRKTPKFINKIIAGLFPVLYWFSKGDFEGLIAKVNSFRRELGLPLP